MNSVAIPASAPAPALSAEADLVRSAARGDADAFGELYRRHSEPAWRLAQAVAPDRDTAGVAFRDGFVRSLRSYRAPRRASSYPAAFRPEVLAAVYKAAVDQAYDRSAPPAANRRAQSDAGLALASAAFRSLPERWRAAVWLTEVESMDVERVAPILGVSAAVASQLVVRGKRGLSGRFIQAHQQVPEHLGEVLRATALATPASLMQDTRARFATAGTERGPVIAPIATWLEERAVRPMSVAVGALVGLGLIGLGVVPQGSPLRSQLGASGAGSLAGAIPAQTCLGLPCSTGSGVSHTALGAGGSTVAGLLGGAGGFGATSPSSAGSGAINGGAGSGSGSGSGSLTGSVPGGSGSPAINPPTTGGGSGTGGGTSTGTPGAGTGTPNPPHPVPTPSTVISLAPVASVTSSGTALNVNLLPTSSGTAPVTATVGGCSSIIGLTVGSINLGCPSSATNTSSPTPPPSSPTLSGPTTSSSPSTGTGTLLGGVTSTVGGVASTVGGTLAPVTNTLSGLTSGL